MLIKNKSRNGTIKNAPFLKETNFHHIMANIAIITQSEGQEAILRRSKRISAATATTQNPSVPYWPHGDLDMSKIPLEAKRKECVRCGHFGCGMQVLPYPCIRSGSPKWIDSDILPEKVRRNTQCPCFAQVIAIDGVHSSI